MHLQNEGLSFVTLHCELFARQHGLTVDVQAVNGRWGSSQPPQCYIRNAAVPSPCVAPGPLPGEGRRSSRAVLAAPLMQGHQPALSHSLLVRNISACSEIQWHECSFRLCQFSLSHATVGTSPHPLLLPSPLCRQVRQLRAAAAEVRQHQSQKRGRAAQLSGLPPELADSSVLASLATGVEGQQRGGLSFARLGEWASLEAFHQVRGTDGCCCWGQGKPGIFC